MIERGNTTIPSILSKQKKSFTSAKIEAYSNYHNSACQKLELLTRDFAGLQDLVGLRQSIMHTVNDGCLKSYLDPLGFQSAVSSISNILKIAETTSNSRGRQFQSNLQGLSESVGSELSQFKYNRTFFVRDYILPFLRNAEREVEYLQSSMSERFECTIEPPEDIYEIPKKYPLHIVDTPFEIHIPLKNTGPGVACDVRAFFVTDNCNLPSDETHLADLNPGSLILPLQLSVSAPSNRIEVQISIEWEVLGHTHIEPVTLP